MKRLLCLVLTIVLAVCLTACGSEDESAKEGKNRVGKGKSTPTPSEVVTPSEVPTGEPETPTPVPTEEPTPEITVTPTPVASEMPVPDVKEGPNYVVAHGDGCDRYSEKFTGEGPAFDSEIDYLYITEYEYETSRKLSERRIFTPIGRILRFATMRAPCLKPWTANSTKDGTRLIRLWCTEPIPRFSLM